MAELVMCARRPWPELASGVAAPSRRRSCLHGACPEAGRGTSSMFWLLNADQKLERRATVCLLAWERKERAALTSSVRRVPD